MSDIIIGSDEVGYGAWAGPLYVCAVAQPKSWKGLPGLDDSKKLSPAERCALYPALLETTFVITSAPVECIDRVGVKYALLDAHTQAVHALLRRFPGADVVIDGVLRLPDVPQALPVPKADALFPVVSAASVIAKVNRDVFMTEQHRLFPYYDWASNKGYGSATHEAGLAKHGVSSQHRRSYAPIKKLLENT